MPAARAYAAPTPQDSVDVTAPAVTLTPLGTYDSGFFDAEAAEIVTYDPATQRVRGQRRRQDHRHPRYQRPGCAHSSARST
ncbi:MAG: hypothetical protein R3A10_09290 [Caldilineaceae bacterium]